ncbi:MAG: protein-glutamate O-methyltransferase CheR [candidate division NC10 bacterium]|nr:protein-glutamate O-methyltransferase CheR [candidate division NC10 bacterium]
MNKNELEEIELSLLLEGVYQRYGYDFREYAEASLKRRVRQCIREEQVTTISGLQEKILREPACMERFLMTMSVDVTAMFRDPAFYLALRKKVVPLLRAEPFIRIWHAGCAGGEEVYSMAILLQEEGLYEKSRLYATDMNGVLLEKAKAGIFKLNAMKDYTANYMQAGGLCTFADYYVAKYDNAILGAELRTNIVWAQHNLVTDASFNEFHLILCRNVMIYFNKSLQARVHNLLYDSLADSGVLGLGSKESIKFTSHETDYDVLDDRHKLYRRRK